MFVIRFPRDKIEHFKRHDETSCSGISKCNLPHTDLEEEVWSLTKNLGLCPVPHVSVVLGNIHYLNLLSNIFTSMIRKEKYKF